MTAETGPSPRATAADATAPAGSMPPATGSWDGGHRNEAAGTPRPGLREEIGETRRALARVVRAHVDLLRAELGEIARRIAVIAALGGALVAIGLFVGNLLLIGTFLFLGEWLFGSLGWGVLHGTLLGIGLLTAVALVLFSAPRRVIFLSLLLSVLAGVAVALLLAFNLPRTLALAGTTAALTVLPQLDPGWAALIIGAVVLAIVFGLLGLVIGARSGGGRGAFVGARAGVAAGAILGALLGVLTFSPHGGVAVGIAVAGLLWPVLQVLLARAARIDPRARFEQLRPRETYETVLETRAWLEREWARRRERLARR
ncbi:MAG: hypothetical protein M3301_04285 [Chloroflexota bacterium]|nr:hypothetical protein [Chloroflexota bacterium]